ncbi:hypothetical protein BHE74_00044975 [Ensete ventricosum]|nr:hypothetical protein GW17_00016026 [Ensete ventricosum]RWW48917.1 hypothetical protein BHE74_00044975 [Ensete ventricosum]
MYGTHQSNRMSICRLLSAERYQSLDPVSGDIGSVLGMTATAASDSSDGGELQRTTVKRNDNRDGVGDVIQATEAGSRALGREQ